MNIFLSPYDLKPVGGGLPRKGYLLKQQDEDGVSGYADIFPWTDFGDPTWAEIPKLLLANGATPLLKRSLELAKRDREARIQRKSLMAKGPLENHYLMSPLGLHSIDEMMRAFASGFKRVKIKVARKGQIEKKFFDSLPSGLPEKGLRLDANTGLSQDDFRYLLKWEDKIEYIEDPFQRSEDWIVRNDWLAFDQPNFESHQVDCLWQVIKPAKQDVEEIKKQRVIFSSYLDHPVGIAHAFSIAQEWGIQHSPYGLASQNYYQKTDFHEALQMRGPEMTIDHSNYGIGFDEILSKLDWVDLRRMCELV